MPPACPQVTALGESVFTVSSPQFNNHAPWDEDCLKLSVWAPTGEHWTPDEKLPVFIWIHGGGLQSGSSSVPYQQPPPWIQRTRRHIVVGVQYRLNIFGFPNAAGSNRTNIGLLDQRLAIEWVRDNVEAFGGDLNKTILWGQSSGAGTVDALNFAFPNDPIVQGFISDSGSALFPVEAALVTLDPTHSNFSTVAKGLDCPSDPQGELKCMRSASAESIVPFMTNYTTNQTLPMLNFIATPDNELAFANYTQHYLEGKLSNFPAIFGTNANEGVVMQSFPSDPTQQGPSINASFQDTLGFYQCPAYFTSVKRAAAGRHTYQYKYFGNFSDVSPLFWEGPYHMSELPQIFGTRGGCRAAATEYEIQTSNAMQDLWLGFAQNPSNSEAVGWVEHKSGKILALGSPNGQAVEQVDLSTVADPCIQLQATMAGKATTS